MRNGINNKSIEDLFDYDGWDKDKRLPEWARNRINDAYYGIWLARITGM